MTVMKTFRAFLITAAAVSMVFATLLSAAFAAQGVRHLPGRWTGWGTIEMSSGSTDKMKCVATYFVEKSGRKVKQNLRCSSGNFKIDGAANFVVTGDRVSGTWEERVHANGGPVTGFVSGNKFNLSVTGQAVSAKISMSTTACKQSITIIPTGIDVKRMAINLKKC